MSHNIILANVKFTDLTMLGNVVTELSKGLAELKLNQKTFRTYRGQDGSCDHMIQMPGRHDIGLKANSGGFSPVFDPYTMDPVFKGGTNFIGKLQQEVVLRQAEYEAAQNGYSTERVSGANGDVTLEIAVPA